MKLISNINAYPDVCPNISNGPVPDLSAVRKVTREDALRAPTVACFSYLYATQVAAAVPVLISSADREFFNLNGAFAEPGTNPDLCIEARHGICGNQTWVGIELLKFADLKARPVEFYYSEFSQRQNHIIPEVLIDGGWRPIDTTYGGYWIDSTPGVPFALRTLEEVLDKSISGTKLIRNRALLPGRLALAVEVALAPLLELLENLFGIGQRFALALFALPVAARVVQHQNSSVRIEFWS